MQLKPTRAGAGFTLVEMMVGLAVGLILISSVLALVMANLQNTNTVVRGVRLTQESRALTEVVTRELRRVRYDGSAMNFIGSGAVPSTFGQVQASIIVNTASHRLDCIKYSYDENGNGLSDAGEFKMFSGAVVDGRGVVRFGRFDSAATVNCSQGEVISSEEIDITCLSFTHVTPPTTLLTVQSGDARACFGAEAPSPAVTLASVPADAFYFAVRMALPLDIYSTSHRRTDGVVMTRSPNLGP